MRWGFVITGSILLGFAAAGTAPAAVPPAAAAARTEIPPPPTASPSAEAEAPRGGQGMATPEATPEAAAGAGADPAAVLALHPVHGVDVSGWQHPNGTQIDWGRVRAAGVGFATIKATEGSAADSTAYTNAWFRGDLAGALAQGLAVSPYHYYLGRTPNTGVAQADHFIATLRGAGYTGKRPGELPPILDIEWDWKGGKCPPHATAADARAWLDRVEAAFGRRPIIYTNKYFITGCMAGTTALGPYPLQIANYSVAANPPLPPGFSSWLMWQWTSKSCVDGVPTCNLTRSVFNGPAATLNTWALR